VTSEQASVDLVVASVDRAAELGRLFDSLERQSHRQFRVLLVDQNDDGRLDALTDRPFELTRLRAPRGLSRARNAALGEVRADLVAFPDDDCIYPDDLLERVTQRFAADPSLDGLIGRAADARGHSSPSWARDAARLDRDNLWNRAISFTIFLRASLVEQVGSFDEELGLGAGTPWSSGEEIDYLARAVEAGARIEYEPTLVVVHEDKQHDPQAVGARDGASVGYLLRKHRYPTTSVARMLIRPIGGVVLALLRGDRDRARFHLATFRGRVRGYRARSASNTSA
jgi:glycosyltransferase involved in cell wall biosynthesis